MGQCMSAKSSKSQVLKPQANGDKKIGRKELQRNYPIDKNSTVLGQGAFGKVFLTHNKHNTEHKVAIKVMTLKKVKDELDAIKEEVAILTKLDHPNIVRYYETYEDDKNIYLVMEYIGGGELFDKIAQQKNQVFNEVTAYEYIYKLFGALNHMHAQGIVHRDIKPENIMIGDNGELKLIDFGLSKRKKAGKQLQTIAGTPYYMAPEIQSGNYDSQCDNWSVGVLLYVFMSGYLPFQGQDRGEVFEKIKNADYHFKHEEFQIVTSEAKDLISKLLVADPSKRLTAGGALNHPWMKMMKEANEKKNSDNPDFKPTAFNTSTLKRLQSFRGVSKLKKAAMNMLVKMADQSQIEELRKDFAAIDKDGTHMINAEELRQAIKSSNLNIPDDQIDAIIDEVDYMGNKKINYSEFLVATMDIQRFLDEEKLSALFNQFDTDGSGVISKENIIQAMNKVGHEITQEDLDNIMEQHDLANDGVISKQEFKALLLDITDLEDAKTYELSASMRQKKID